MKHPLHAVAFWKRFLLRDIWSYTNEDVKGCYSWLINIFKSVCLSVRFFLAHRIMERASALTYYTLLAVVPAFALLIGLGRGFGLQDAIRSALTNANTGHAEAAAYILDLAENYLEQSKTGVVLGVGIVMLIYVIYNLFGNIETVFNEIWQQKEARTFVRKVTDYLSLMIIVPLILALSSGAQIFVQTYVRTDLSSYHELSKTLLHLIRTSPYVLTILMMTFIYITLPNCKVHVKNAFVGGLISGSVFIAFQWLYISGQIWVSKYNALYGSFAALPLLLLWIQTSWVICLYGAELTYASQNIENYNFADVAESLSREDKDFIALLVAALVYNRFHLCQPAPTTGEIGRFLRLPARFTGEVVRRLAEVGILRECVGATPDASNNWLPARETDTFSVSDFMQVLSRFGENTLKINYPQSFKKEWQTMLAMEEAAYERGRNLLLRDIDAVEFKPITYPNVQ